MGCRRKKVNIKKLFLLILTLSVFAFGSFKIIKMKRPAFYVDKEGQQTFNKEGQQTFNKEDKKWQQIFKPEDKEYPVIKLDTNANYQGIGQEKVPDKDGFFTTFTTSDDNRKTYIEYKQNGNSSWKDNPYWNSSMEESGCGIVVLSILLSGYGQNYTPEDLRNKYYPYLDYRRLSNYLNYEYNIDSTDFLYSFTEKEIINHLKTNRPIIICVWNKLENRWTTQSHYMLLLAADDNNLVYVSNPNGLLDSSKSSGWYDISEVLPYLAKVMYINSYN